MAKAWERQNIKAGERQMRHICDSVIFLLFLIALRVPILTEQMVAICILFFEGYLLVNHKKLLLDVKFFILLFTMPLHVLIYYNLVNKMEIGTAIAMAFFPALFYLMGKQLLYYPHEENKQRKIWRVIGAILIGHFILSGLEIYAYCLSPDFPARIWNDFWTGETIYATQYSFFAIIWVSLLFYSFWVLKKKPWFGISLLIGIFVINALNIFNRNRMHLGVMIVVFVFSLAMFCIQNRKHRGLITRVLIMVVGVVVFLVMIYIFDVGNVREIPYVQRFLSLATSDRMSIYKNVLKQMPVYLWGGRQMDLGVYGHAHNMWLQMYNDSGIITFSLMCVFAVLSIWDWVRIIASSKVETAIKYIIPPICFGFFLYLVFEVGGEKYNFYYTFFAGMAAQLVQKCTSD